MPDKALELLHAAEDILSHFDEHDADIQEWRCKYRELMLDRDLDALGPQEYTVSKRYPKGRYS